MTYIGDYMVAKILKIFLLFILIYSIFTFNVLSGEEVAIPGNPTTLARYLDFFYNFPSRDFIYHLNDMLIFSEAPTKKIFKKGIRSKLLKIIKMGNKIEKLIKTKFRFEKNMFTINTSNGNGFFYAVKLLNYLGLNIEKNDSGIYSITEDTSSGIVDYHRFANIKIKDIESLINKTNRLFYNHTNSTMEIPFNFDFLKKCSGLDVNKDNFLSLITDNKRFSILIGILYRLSNNEINYIKKLQPDGDTWKTIYSDKQFLLGMFNLSTAFRVNNGKLLLPGGEEWSGFWSALSGVKYTNSDISFIKSIAIKDDGKLNYLFSFSFFLPESKLKPLLFNKDISKMKEIFNLITLGKNEKLSKKHFARLRKQGFFRLLFALNVKNGSVYFPGNINNWIHMLNGKRFSKEKRDNFTPNELYFELVKTLLNKKNTDKSAIEKFISIYSKFSDRAELITDETLNLFYSNYNKYCILNDFIEKINLKKSNSVTKLFEWVKKTANMKKNERIFYTAVYQSMFEILSFSSRYNPTGFDFDKLTTELISIPLEKDKFLEEFFNFLNRNIKNSLRKKSFNDMFFDFLLGGIENNMIILYKSEFELMGKNMLKRSLKKIITSQEAINLSTIFKFNDLLNRLLSSNKATKKSRFHKIVNLFQKISHPEISEEAPIFIKKRVMFYKISELNKDLSKLQILIEKKNSDKKLKKIIDKFKSKYIFPRLKNYLVTMAYALNAKTDKLRIFINPNLVKLHDFSDNKKNTPWNYSGRPDSSLSIKALPGFRLKGGLSRLNIAFSSVWRDQMLAGNIIFDMDFIESVFTNLLNMYPYVELKYFPKYVSLLINYGVNLMDNGKNIPNIKKKLKSESGKFISGNSYKNIIDYLDGKAKKPLLFYDQYFKLGRNFFKYKDLLDTFYAKDELKKFFQPRLKAKLKKERKWFGNIYFKSFGSLKPKWRESFPPETGNLIKSGAPNGEFFREFKMKLSYLAHKKKYPPVMYGHFLFNYLITTFPKYYQQNYNKDYYTTFFVFNILNNANLSKIIKRYQKKGYVRLR